MCGNGGILNVFSTSAPDSGERSASRPGQFTSGENSTSAQRTGGWVGHRAALDAVQKTKCLISAGNRTLRMSLYRLSHFGSEYNSQQLYMKVGIVILLWPFFSEAEPRAPRCAGWKALQMHPILRGWSMSLPFAKGINIPRSVEHRLFCVCMWFP